MSASSKRFGPYRSPKSTTANVWDKRWRSPFAKNRSFASRVNGQTATLFYQCYKEALNFTDISYDTTLQLLRVFSNVFTNYKENAHKELNICTDSDNSNSWFNQTVHGGEKIAGLTALEWGLGFGIIFPVMIGVARRYYIIKHEIKLKSKEYLLERIKETRKDYFGLDNHFKYFGYDKHFEIDLNTSQPSSVSTAEKVRQRCKLFLENKPHTSASDVEVEKLVEKELFQLFVKSIADKLLLRHQRRSALDEHAFISDAEIEKFVDRELKNSNYYAHLIHRARNTTIATKIKSTYDKFSETAGVFWFTCMGAILVTGITATFAPPFITVIAISSVAISTLVNVAYAVARNINHLPPFKNEVEKSLEAQKHLRVFLKTEQQLFIDNLKNILQGLASERKLENYQAKFPKIFTEHKHYKSIAEIRDEIGTTDIEDAYTNHTHYSEQRHRRFFAISSIKSMVNHATTIFFILWLVTSTFVGLAYFPAIAPMMSGLAAIFGDPLLGFKLAGLAIGITGISAYVDHLRYKLHYEFKSRSAGAAFYKPEKDSDDSHASKQTAYNVLHQRTYQLNLKLMQAKETIKQQRAERVNNGTRASKETLDAEDFILKLKIIDVSNDYLFENMKPTPNKKSQAKKAFNRGWSFYAGLQTWIFNVRNVALYGGPVAKYVAGAGVFLIGPLYGPLAAFLCVAAFFGVLGGVVSVTDYQMSKNDHHKIEFINKIDARLSLLSKNYVKLDYGCKLFDILNYSSSKRSNSVVTKRAVKTPGQTTQKLFDSTPPKKPRGHHAKRRAERRRQADEKHSPIIGISSLRGA